MLAVSILIMATQACICAQGTAWQHRGSHTGVGRHRIANGTCQARSIVSVNLGRTGVRTSDSSSKAVQTYRRFDTPDMRRYHAIGGGVGHAAEKIRV
jgi:hypothetical protein